MSTDLPGLGSNRMQAMVYGYDQLHRIVQTRSLTAYGSTGYAQRGTGAEAYDVDYGYDANGNLLTLKRLDENTSLRDNLTYEYYDVSNKLKNVDGSVDENYTYDEIGNLITDVEEGIDSIAWTPYGKVSSVFKSDNSSVSFRYDASGNRIAKIASGDTTVYVRDASGNVMGVYKNDTLIEQSIYGSSRLGLMTASSKAGYRTLGGKKYELSNHLGNVLSVVTDNIHLDQDSTWASVVNVTDYYPFGLAMDGRTVQDSTYRYGFNGKEHDQNGEWGSKSHYDYGFRIYNPSIAKFLSVDPLASSFPWNSTYAFAEGSPMSNIDLDGLEKLDFRTHLSMGVASGNPVQGLVTYPLDWLEDKVMGGTERYLKGGLRYAQNERNHQEYLERPNQHYPTNIEYVNYLGNKLEATGDMIRGATDILEGSTAVMSAAMGGIESGITNSFANGASPFLRSTPLVSRVADEANRSVTISAVDDIISSAGRIQKGKTTRGIQALSKKIGRGDEPYKGLKATQENVNSIIRDVMGAEKRVSNITRNQQGVEVIDHFNSGTKQGVRLIKESGEFDTFINQ